VPVQIHERIEVDGGGRGKLVELLRSWWAQHAAERYGVRLAGVWATVGSTAHWPELHLIWEMEDWAHFARAQQAQFPLEDRDAYGTELWFQALEYRQRGTAALLSPAAFSPALRAVEPGELFLYEDVRARPGYLGAYHAALRSEYLPVAEKRGLRLFGAFRHALVPNAGINLWALRGWDHWRELMETEYTDPAYGAWLERCAALLEDLDGYNLVAPPAQPLRT
jgi:hypothetical protein